MPARRYCAWFPSGKTRLRAPTRTGVVRELNGGGGGGGVAAGGEGGITFNRPDHKNFNRSGRRRRKLTSGGGGGVRVREIFARRFIE